MTTPHIVCIARKAGFSEPRTEGEFRCSHADLERFADLLTADLIRALSDLEQEADKSLDMRPEFRRAIARASAVLYPHREFA